MPNRTNAVVLPCSTHDFGSFISSILGKPQTITNTIKGPFEIDQNNVLNIYALLCQRVAQQNEGTLALFTAKLIFSDDSSVLLNSIDEFSAYNEVRSVACLSLHLSWVFLVKFNGKSHPEKQQIDLSFLGGITSPVIDSDIPILLMAGLNSGFIFYRISHTARTWGADIDSLLASHMRNVVDEVPKIRKWLAKYNGKIALLTFCILFLSSIVASFTASTHFVEKQRTNLKGIYSSTSQPLKTVEQMNYLLDTVALGTWARFQFTTEAFLLLSLVLSIGIAVWVSTTANNIPPSFLLLTKESEKRKKRILAKRNRKWLSFLASVVVGLLLGIGGNIFY
ncbi:TPA: hypothetical protein DDW35_06440, partial [Candidatus Sumerlaeota bacterium]|nr:hypothetical protein [Candidatus Sumerlaeota bacterium]